MSKVAIRVIRDSKHVGTVSRKAIAEAVRMISREGKSGNLTVKRSEGGQMVRR